MLTMVFVLFTVTASAVTEEEVQQQITANGKEAVSGNVFVWFLCAIAFLKISQKIDSFMSSLGISVGHTGGSMLAEAMMLTRGVTGSKGGFGGFGMGRSGSGGGSPGSKSPGGSLGLSGGLAGVVGRQFQNDAIGSATGTGGNMLSNQAFNSSLKKDGAFANGVVGAVAKGNMSQLGSITGDKASSALASYMGLGKSGGGVGGIGSSVGGGKIPTGMPESSSGTTGISGSPSIGSDISGGLDPQGVPISSSPDGFDSSHMDASPLDGAQALESGGVPSFEPVDAVDYSDATSALETAIGGEPGIGAYPMVADEISEAESGDGHTYTAPPIDNNGGVGISESPYSIEEEAVAGGMASGGVPSYEPADTVDYGNEASAYEAAIGGTPSIAEYPGATEGNTESSHVPSSVDGNMGNGIPSIPPSPYSASEEVGGVKVSETSEVSGGGSVSSVGTTPITPDSINSIPKSPYSDSNVGGQAQPSVGSAFEQPIGVGASHHEAAIAPNTVSSVPKFENVEIGGGRITGREVTPQNPQGREFAMYNTDQYTAPQGKYDIVKSVDNAKWYKQYAVSAVEKTPKMGKTGKIEYNEKIVQVMPPMPKRKDKI